MTDWIECVPNFSEGRDPAVIDALADAVQSVNGAHLLDVHADRAHHRSVFTMAGAVVPVCEAVFRATQVATERIDLTRHSGEHPRLGATDVVPLIPLEGATIEDCVALARSLATRIARELHIPVFLYGHSAPRRLSDLRRGGVAALEAGLRAGSVPDPEYGPGSLHPTAGATAVGARGFLVAYNVFLETSEKSVAEGVAARVRTSGGGLPGVQAKGFDVAGRAQVSMNLLDVDTTTPMHAYEAVARLAKDAGVEVSESEFVGLVPERAVEGLDGGELRLATPLGEHLLEPKLRAVRS